MARINIIQEFGFKKRNLYIIQRYTRFVHHCYYYSLAFLLDKEKVKYIFFNHLSFKRQK